MTFTKGYITLLALFAVCGCREPLKKPYFMPSDITILQVKCGKYWKTAPHKLRKAILQQIDTTDDVVKTENKAVLEVRMFGRKTDTIHFGLLKGYAIWESGWASKSNTDSNIFHYICNYSLFNEDIPIGELWDVLVNDYGGCLTGGQRIRNGRLGTTEGCVLSKNKNWEAFFKRDKGVKLNFLITQFADTTKSAIHTCPFSLATNGEIAVYVAQEAVGTNWFELPSFSKYHKMMMDGKSEGNGQIWLQAILSDENQRQLLITELSTNHSPSLNKTNTPRSL